MREFMCSKELLQNNCIWWASGARNTKIISIESEFLSLYPNTQNRGPLANPSLPCSTPDSEFLLVQWFPAALEIKFVHYKLLSAKLPSYPSNSDNFHITCEVELLPWNSSPFLKHLLNARKTTKPKSKQNKKHQAPKWKRWILRRIFCGK